MLGIQPKFQTSEKQKNREKKTPKEKQSHTHKIVFTWFGNLPTSTELQKFHYYKRKLQCAVTVFFFSKTTKRQNPNHKKEGLLYPSHRIHNELQKQTKNFVSAQASAPWTKP